MNLQNNKTKNFTPLPNDIFSLHLSTGELATYAVLMRLEDPRTYECWPSYETIGKAIGKSKSSVKRYVAGWQKKYISLQAEKAHKSLSQYVRDAAMDKDVTVIDGVDDLIRELRRQGNNLNQLVVMARQGHVELVNMEPFMEVYENTWQTLNSLLSRVG